MSKKTLIKSASIISSGTFLSRILGFLRDVLLANTFGVGWFAQAFFVAFRIPNMFRDLAGEGASNSALVPVFSDYLNTKSRSDFWKLVNSALVAFVVVVTIIALAGMLFAPFLVRLIAPGFVQMPEKLGLTIAINRPLFAYLILISISAFLIGVLHTFKSFFAPSFSPCIFNIILITSILFADNTEQGIWKLVLGVIIAGFFQIIIQLPTLFKKGYKFISVSLRESFRHSGVRRIGKLLVPRIVGTALYQLNVLIDVIFASLSFLVGEGAIAAIYYATRLIQFPLGLFGHSISNATLPLLSELAAKKEIEKYAETVEFSLTNILFIMFPSGFGLMVLSQPIIKMIFERGAFTQYSTTITSLALSFYAIGLAAFALNKFLALCFNALQDTVTPVKVSGLALMLNIIFNTFFVIILRTGIAGLAFASSLSAVASSLILFIVLQKRINQISLKNIIDQGIKMLLSALAMAVCVFIIWHKITVFMHPIVGVFLTICCALVVYIVFSLILKVYQATNLTKWILRSK